MRRHSLSFAAASMLAIVSSPAVAQDGGYDPYEHEAGEPSLMHRDGEPQYHPEADYHGPAHGPYDHDEWAGYDEALPPMPHAQRRPGYSLAERDAWLAQCRASYYGYERDRTGRRQEGGIIGSVLGAVTGGIIGNRVADGERLGGTLIGAGVGGLAGLAVGAAIDAASGDGGRDGYDDYDRIDECEAYLLQWEADYERRLAYARPYGDYYGYGYAPVMMVRVPIVTEHRHTHDHDADCTEEVVEEWIEEEVVQPTPTKTVSIKTVPSKAVPIKTTSGKTVPVKTRTIKTTKSAK